MTARMIALVAALPLAAAAPPGVVHWRAAELRAFAKQLAPKINAQKVAAEQLAKFGNHSFMIAHREGSGEAELHEGQADIFVVESGEAEFVVGGEMVGGKTIAPGEIRGTSTKGGEKMRLGPGDIVTVPAKVPHQLFLAPGRQFTYFVVKIDTP